VVVSRYVCNRTWTNLASFHTTRRFNLTGMGFMFYERN
jgi:hypothetical protein